MITEKGEVTARDCLSRSELGNFEGPSVSASVCNMSAGPCLDETMSGPFMTIRRSHPARLFQGIVCLYVTILQTKCRAVTNLKFKL
jgi:hypothetical protein